MRILILTQYYPPEMGAPQNRLADLARRMQARGHHVTVVTAMPNYPAGRVFQAWRGRALARETVDGIDILRSWIYLPRRRSTAFQLASYGSFVMSAALTAPFRAARVDLVLWESPPLFLAPTAYLLARRLGARLVMNVSDLWPQSAIDLGMLKSGRLQKLFRWLERSAYRAADIVTGQTDHIVDNVRAVSPETPAVLFPNGVDLDYFQRKPRNAALLERLGIAADAHVVGYVGTFGRAQALEQVLDAADRLRERSDIAFFMMGDGPQGQKIRDMARERELRNVVFSPPQSRETMPSVLSSLDVAVVPLADRPVFEGARPSKMFELFAMQVPVIFCGRGEGALLARTAGAVVVDPECPEALAAEIVRLLASPCADLRAMGGRGRRFVLENYDREAIARELEHRLQQVVDRRAILLKTEAERRMSRRR